MNEVKNADEQKDDKVVSEEKISRKFSAIEKSVKRCVDRAESSLQGINPTEEDMDWSIVDDPMNPTKEEILKQLAKIPSIQAYFSNMQVYAQYMLEVAQLELELAQVKARESFREVHRTRVLKYEEDIAKRMELALRSTAQKESMQVIKEMVRVSKPKDPTDKEIESFVKGRTFKEENTVIMYRGRCSKLKSYCKSLDMKFNAAKAMNYSIEDSVKADVRFSKNSV